MPQRFPFYSCLSSNGQKNIFPNNNPIHFANFLQVPIQPRDTISNRLFVRLKSISFWHELEPNQPFDKDNHFFKIKLEELEHLPGCHELDQVLAVVPFTPIEEEEKYKLLEVENKIFLPLQSLPLRQLTVSITDSKDKPLKLKSSSSPTLAFLEITDMDFCTDFTITCFSRDRQQLCTGNTLYHFDHYLPKELHLQDYEVALGDIFYPPTLKVKTQKLEPLAFLTCDIVENSFVAGQMMHLLRLVPLPISLGGEGDRVKAGERFFRPDHAIFHPVKNHPFSFITFELLNPDGKPHVMEEVNTQDGLILTLMFRRKRQT